MLIVSLDHGMSSGCAVLEALSGEPPVLISSYQVPGGASGLIELLGVLQEFQGNSVWICEKFTARNTRGFSYTTAALEPLRCEGVLIAKGLMPDYTPKERRWRDPGLQYLVGGKDLAAKRSRQHAFLEDSGFYRTNKDFPDSPSKDKADDFRSAAAHGIAYLAREVGNKPAFSMIADWVESHGG